MYTIWGKYQGEKEEIDTADDVTTAKYLVGEYRMAYGAGWSIWYTRTRGTK